MPSVSREIKTIAKHEYCAQCRVTQHKKELKRCARCQNVKYCSQDCQRTHRKEHKKFCRSREAMQNETEEESWAQVAAEYGHKKSNNSQLGPVTESLEEQDVRFKAWVDKWQPTLWNWAFWAMNIPSPSTREDILLYFTFAFELQRRVNPPTEDQYFEVRIRISFVFLGPNHADARRRDHAQLRPHLLKSTKRFDVLKRWQAFPRRPDLIQIMVRYRGHIIFINRPVSNFADLQTTARADPVRSKFYAALAKDWVNELRKALESQDPEYHEKYYVRLRDEIILPAMLNPIHLLPNLSRFMGQNT
ncbi:hypothetical protein FB45DRAFT_217078 [Roridomyces roridus]|uniref:MYND-type domain-containing protein n=1 Tax=Roridomyces roridus TaxID=1738132 RepID=A0AAD7BDV7_9AGAR|nr:hypothetical protein FB45DRAFT_217078 [Roridomyces roridus]